MAEIGDEDRAGLDETSRREAAIRDLLNRYPKRLRFDDFLRHSYPGFRRPGTLLLPMSIRIPVFAGVSRVARRPADWAESLLSAVGQSALSGLTACFRELGAN